MAAALRSFDLTIRSAYPAVDRARSLDLLSHVATAIFPAIEEQPLRKAIARTRRDTNTR